MNFVESFNFYGVDAKQIPHILGEGAPTTSTEGAVGCTYMDTTTGDTYKCVAVSGTGTTSAVTYTWVPESVYFIDLPYISSTIGNHNFEHSYRNTAEILERINAGEVVICRMDGKHFYYMGMLYGDGFDDYGNDEVILQFANEEYPSGRRRWIMMGPGYGTLYARTLGIVDDSLRFAGCAADAKAVGDALPVRYYASVFDDGSDSAILESVVGKTYPSYETVLSDWTANPDRTYEIRLRSVEGGTTYILPLLSVTGPEDDTGEKEFTFGVAEVFGTEYRRVHITSLLVEYSYNNS